MTINSMNYDGLPEHMRKGMKRYVEDHIAPGDFAMAVLSNDLCGAVSRADIINIRALQQWVMWLYWVCPRDAWGSAEIVAAWLSQKKEIKNRKETA